jgi:hypothetical protein
MMKILRCHQNSVAQFIGVCSSSTLAEKLAISPPFQSPSYAKKRASWLPTHFIDTNFRFLHLLERYDELVTLALTDTPCDPQNYRCLIPTSSYVRFAQFLAVCRSMFMPFLHLTGCKFLSVSTLGTCPIVEGKNGRPRQCHQKKAWPTRAARTMQCA